MASGKGKTSQVTFEIAMPGYFTTVTGTKVGEWLCVHGGVEAEAGVWRISHISTGMGVPHSFCASRSEALIACHKIAAFPEWAKIERNSDKPGDFKCPPNVFAILSKKVSSALSEGK